MTTQALICSALKRCATREPVLTAIGNTTVTMCVLVHRNVYEASFLFFIEPLFNLQAHGDLQNDVMKSRMTDGLETDISEWRETWHSTLKLH